MVILPEILLKKRIEYLLEYIKTDTLSIAVSESDKFLYRLFNGSVIGNYDYYEQATALFTKTDDDPRKIETRMFFDRTRAHCPTIHITLPSNHPYGDGISTDNNYVAPQFNDIAGTYSTTNTRSFVNKYNLIITSDNTFEVLLMFYCLQSLMIADMQNLELNGFRNIKFSAQDLIINDAMMPTNIFMRSLIMDFFFEINIPSLNINTTINDITSQIILKAE